MENSTVKIITSLLYEAGEIITKERDTHIASRRSQSDYTTFTDMKVESFITEQLRKFFPESVIIAEESSSSRSSFQLEGEAFVLDPIDGTVNFYHGYPAFAISLAYIEDYTIQQGYIYDPINEEFFSAVKDKGAYLNGDPICVSQTGSLSESLIGFGTAYDKKLGKEEISIVTKIYEKCHDVRRRGAASLDMAYVACGRLDGYLEMDLKPWDFYAGLLLMEEAGGKASNWKGLPIQDLDNQHILCTNKLIHTELQSFISRFLK